MCYEWERFSFSLTHWICKGFWISLFQDFDWLSYTMMKKTKKSRNRLLGFNHKNENELLVRTGYRRYHLALFKFFEKLYFTYFWSLKNRWDNRWDNSDFRHSKIDMKPEVVLKPKIPWHTNQFFDIRWDKFQD